MPDKRKIHAKGRAEAGLYSAKERIIPCALSPERKALITSYVADLKAHAHEIGDHGLSYEEFWKSGIFQSAIERIRGTQAASTKKKREFVEEILSFMKGRGDILSYTFTGSHDRHDYQVELSDGTHSVFEMKGCLDGNNTTIYTRPANAEEFTMWSLCQNSSANPGHNAWSGIHTRLGGKIISRREIMDGLIIWDMLCGTSSRPCPKIIENPERATKLPGGRVVPPPCLYLLPKTVPDVRNNPAPKSWKLAEIGFLKALYDTFKGKPDDVTEVIIECRMNEVTVERMTKLVRNEKTVCQSRWTKLNQAKT